MKKLLLYSILSVGLINTALADVNLVYKHNGQPVTNGAQIQVWGDVNTTELTYHDINVINNTGGTTKINVKRIALTSQTNVEDYFCWYVCLGAVVTSSTPVLNHSNGACFNSNDTDTITYFSGYYKPNSTLGSSTFRYVWYDVARPIDSAWVDITYNVTPLSINEISLSPSANIYPNPAKDLVSLTTENIDLNGNQRIVLFDMIGNKVYEEKLTGIKSTFDVSNFENGVYFMNIISDRKAILTKRIVVNR